MIQHIEIKNFRSIINSSAKLESLTVFVGSNASGKSNIMKALEFIRDAITYGLEDAILERGGYTELLPKQISKPEKESISFRIISSVRPPSGWQEQELPQLTIEYSVTFQKRLNNKVRITEESLVIKEPLLVGAFLKERSDARAEMKPKIRKGINFSEYYGSEIILTRKAHSASVKIQHNITFNKRNTEALAEWIGVRTLLNKNNQIQSRSQLEVFIKTFTEFLDGHPANKDLSISTLILSKKRSIYRFSEHFREIINTLEQTRRYDLFLNELRSEQKSKEARILVNSEGNNIPTVSNQLMKTDNWEEIINTMTLISPYFSNVTHRRLRGGKEYIAFNEIFNGREIESWESSDGTLRAFAILVAIEAHPQHSTILIEEPEHGLHPWAIPYLIGHIKNRVKSKNIQVLITTHSPQVLENIKANELIIVDRFANTGTIFQTIEQVTGTPDPEMNEIGNLWVRGLLNGVPTY